MYSQHRGLPAELASGAELCISYVAGTSPLNMLLNFGFVPPESRR